MHGDRRLGFIQAVGEAADVLTADQREALLGMGPDGAPSEMPPATPGRPTPRLPRIISSTSLDVFLPPFAVPLAAAHRVQQRFHLVTSSRSIHAESR